MKIQERHPFPWRIEADESVNPTTTDGAYIVFNANNETVMNGGTYSGDGDMELNLSWVEAVELVTAMNARADLLSDVKWTEIKPTDIMPDLSKIEHVVDSLDGVH